MLSINDKEAEKKLSIFRKYFVEIMVVILCCVNVYLFKGQKDLENLIRNYLITDKNVLIQKLDSATSLMNVNTDVIKQNSEIILELKYKNLNQKK